MQQTEKCYLILVVASKLEKGLKFVLCAIHKCIKDSTLVLRPPSTAECIPHTHAYVSVNDAKQKFDIIFFFSFFECV